MKEFLLSLFCLCSLLVFVDKTHAHPDGVTPYWYPSSFIYGYVNGCADQVERNQLPFTEEMWPVQVRQVCACVVDAFRHSLTFEEISDNSTNNQAVLIASATFPICVREELAKINADRE